MDPFDSEELASSLRPIHTNTFALPADDGTKLAYAVYNPADAALLLKSEKGRTVFPEAFITNRNLGTLADLCMRALARGYGTESFNVTPGNPLQRRLQLDAIDVDQPLEDIYHIEDIKFWKRVALAKTVDASLTLNKDDYDWKSEGVTLKYLELVEQCPAEFWPEMKMCTLANMIKEHVRHVNIRKLQPLQDFSFAHYCGRDSDTDKATSTDVSETTEEEIVEEQEEEAEEEEQTELPKSRISIKSFESIGSARRERWSFFKQKQLEDNEEDEQEAKRLIAKVEKQTERRREDRRKRRESQQQRRKVREEKLQKREEEQLNQPKPKRIKVQDIFNLPIEEPENDEHKVQDKRNIESYLKFKKKDIYTPDRCHHIDLSFLRHFDRLVSLQIKFQPPELKTKYESRYFNFSHDDVKNLANGIASLFTLRIFRLRDSRMDEDKLATIVLTLNQLSVEEVDFGNDQLDDDCEIGLRELFQNTTTIRSLELEGNHLGVNAMSSLGRAIRRYGGRLEYLGLARNNMDAESLHALISKISNSQQVESLNLAGINISEMAMLCCITEELLSQHKALRRLDMTGVPLSSRGGELLIRGMRNNFNVLHLDCRGCNLSESIELDIEVCVQRNRFKAENPFLGDNSKTEAEINQFVSRVKNPILLAANKRVEQRQACLEARPDVAKRYTSSETTLTGSKISYGLDKIYRPTLSLEYVPASETDSLDSANDSDKFVYDVTKFDIQQFHEHVHVPGPGNRYYYFKAKKSRNCQNID